MRILESTHGINQAERLNWPHQFTYYLWLESPCFPHIQQTCIDYCDTEIEDKVPPLREFPGYSK